MKGSVDPPRFNPSHREGYPNIRTVDYWLGGDKSERYPQSRYALDFWNIGALFLKEGPSESATTTTKLMDLSVGWR